MSEDRFAKTREVITRTAHTMASAKALTFKSSVTSVAELLDAALAELDAADRRINQLINALGMISSGVLRLDAVMGYAVHSAKDLEREATDDE